MEPGVINRGFDVYEIETLEDKVRLESGGRRRKSSPDVRTLEDNRGGKLSTLSLPEIVIEVGRHQCD
jgi:hypothetical protein